tara:strand:+ start:8496 stop:9125 length:630 start_codon:yes stop_codon:yes gene_type:complete
VEDGFEQNGVHTINTGFVSAFAIPISDSEVILVDSGGEEDAASLKIGLEALGYGLDDVTHVFITHGHKDHVAALELLDSALKVGFAQDEPLIEEKLGKKVVLDLPIDDGERMMVGDVMVEAFHLPGHTPGNATYLINNVMLMGDTAMANEDGSVGVPPEFFSSDALAVKDRIKDLWSRLENRTDDVEWMFFAHTGPLQGTNALKTYSVE